VVVAGLIIGNYGKVFSMSKRTRETVETFWEVIDFVVNIFLFLVIGLELQAISIGELPQFAQPVLWGIVVVLLARAVVVYPFVWIRNRTGKDPIPPNYNHVLFWGGLKGSIPIALVVGMPDFAHRELFLVAAFGIVLFSLVVQGLTMEAVLKRFNLVEKKE